MSISLFTLQKISELLQQKIGTCKSFTLNGYENVDIEVLSDVSAKIGSEFSGFISKEIKAQAEKGNNQASKYLDGVVNFVSGKVDSANSKLNKLGNDLAIEKASVDSELYLKEVSKVEKLCQEYADLLLNFQKGVLEHIFSKRLQGESYILSKKDYDIIHDMGIMLQSCVAYLIAMLSMIR